VNTLVDRDKYLASTEVVDWEHPAVRQMAAELAANDCETIAVARRCFEWVRDEIQHTMDFQHAEVTCSASDVLQIRTGFCYAKSHLLAALLRANDIPAGFCYQRLTFDGVGAPYSLHGLNAVWLERYGWYRIDARGNKVGVSAQFSPPTEQLAFAIQVPGECDLPGVFAEPRAEVVEALQRYDQVDALVANLPDCAFPTAEACGSR
jgi:transglutaminase-like putative cysteine protease